MPVPVLARLATVACAAVLALAALAGSATAESIRISPARELTLTSEGAITFSSSLTSVTCNTTLTAFIDSEVETTWARRLPEGLLGELLTGRSAGCRETFGGASEVRYLVEGELPELRYDAFLGTLPNLTGVQFTLLHLKVQVTAVGPTICLYEGEQRLLVTFPPSGRPNRVTFLESSLRLISGGGLCPREGSARGTFRLTPEQTATVQRTRACIDASPLIIKSEAADVTLTPDVLIECAGTRINSITTRNGIAQIQIADRETAIGRTYNAGTRFNYDLRLRTAAGTATYRDDVIINSSNGVAMTRVVFNDT